ncbi:hypothetical protein RchiOBHm_Chr5g0029101 [Rosa chinensis]|uniref:Uncharacterized protein n=1 Tax=Rosa chinensis TaxID=74649 RepID=A0A2P6Q9J4_ROSCH|nr:hypothetical protein RchiOBHm_Chr5g0029101 [Rosa chinensis]
MEGGFTGHHKHFPSKFGFHFLGFLLDLETNIIASVFQFSFWVLTSSGSASGVCRNWKQGVKQSLGRIDNLSFAGWKMGS